MHKEITAIIDDEVRVLLLTEHEHGRVMHRSRDAARKKIGSFHRFLLDITRMLKCPEPKAESSEDSSENQTDTTEKQ